MKIRTQLLLSFSIIVLLVVLISAGAFYGLSRLTSVHEDVVGTTATAKNHIEKIKYLITAQANDERGFLLTGDPQFRKEALDRTQVMEKEVTALRDVLKQEEHKRMLAEFFAGYGEFTKIQVRVMDMYGAGDVAGAQALSFSEGRSKRKTITTVFDELSKRLDEQIVQVQGEFNTIRSTTEKQLIVVTIVVALLSVAIGMLVSRRIVRRLASVVSAMNTLADGRGELQTSTGSSHTGVQDEFHALFLSLNKVVDRFRATMESIKASLHVSSEQSEILVDIASESARNSTSIAHSFAGLVDQARFQSRSASESSIAMEQIASNIQQIVDTTNVVSSSASLFRKNSNDGSRAVEQVMGQMNQIVASTTDISQSISTLNEYSKQVDAIVTMITSIASQTNLLALNASIEAARAGEEGRGFSVVANEVRKLAEQSHHSADQIKRLLELIRQAIEDASASVEQGEQQVHLGKDVVISTQKLLDEISHSSVHLEREVQHIASSTQEISAATEQVSASMEDFVRISEVSSREVDAASKLALEQKELSAKVTRSVEAMQEAESSLKRLTMGFKG